MQSHEQNKIEKFTDLNAWREAHNLVLKTYVVIKDFPKDELFGLTSQLRRAVVSITSNIAEGFSRNSFKEKLQFWAISLGSLTEVQNQLIIARDVGYLSPQDYEALNSQSIVASKLINGLIKKTKVIIHNS